MVRYGRCIYCGIEVPLSEHDIDPDLIECISTDPRIERNCVEYMELSEREW